MDIMIGNMIEVTGAVVPKNVDDREVLRWVPAILNRGSEKAKEGWMMI